MPKPRIAIIGAGAAGLMAAIAAAHRGGRVVLLESGSRVGRKILASGNGRCNLSNTGVSPADYNDPDFVTGVIAACGASEVRDFFSRMGLATYADEEGRVYPLSNTANSVLDVLRLECAHLGINQRLGFVAVSVERATDGALHVQSAEGELVEADAVIVASGGGTSVLSAMGHTVSALTPVLAPIRTKADAIRRLSGIRVRCTASLLDGAGTDASLLATEHGELLFRDYGVSGIMVFDLSRFLESAAVLSIDFFPAASPDDLRELFEARADELSWRRAETFLDGLVHHTLAQALLVAAGIDADARVSPADAARLAGVAKDFRLEVLGVGDPKQAQVTRGGAATAEFDPGTLESRRMRGVFAAGEVLDIDGRCGGYNLHWAWASGLVAGSAAVTAAEAAYEARA